jgi:hypothetical protein
MREAFPTSERPQFCRHRARWCGLVDLPYPLPGKKMKLIIYILTLMVVARTASGEPLDKRFGADRERGYRADREFNGAGPKFKNRDRANFLGAEKTPPAPAFPRNDLQHLPAIGLPR